MRADIVRSEACRSLQAFDGAERARLFEAGIRNELLVEEAGGELVSGVDGVRVLLASAGRPRAAALLGLGPVRAVATFLYRLVATNRRVLAPVDAERRVACDCDPVPRPPYRTAFVLLCLAIALAGAAGLGALLGTGSGHSAARGALVGLALPMLLALPALGRAFLLPRAVRGEALAHVAFQTVRAVAAATVAAGGLVVAFAVVLGALFLLGVALDWGACLELFAGLYPVVWPTALVGGALAATHVFVRGLRVRLRGIGSGA